MAFYEFTSAHVHTSVLINGDHVVAVYPGEKGIVAIEVLNNKKPLLVRGTYEDVLLLLTGNWVERYVPDE